MVNVFLPVADMSITASIVILAVLLVRLLLKRTPKIYSYIMWSVVLLRLLCPVTLESSLSIVPQNAQAVPQGIVRENHENLPTDAKILAAYLALGDISGGSIDGVDVTYISPEYEHYGYTRYTRIFPKEAFMLTLSYIWPVGIAAMLVYSLVFFIKLRRKLIGSVPLHDNIYLVDHITSPFVMGLFRPKIYLPSSLSEKEQEYIILHEQHHIHRLDYIMKALAFAALCIHWFNPLVWVAFVYSSKDMEMSCDEAVLKKLGTEIRADYSASLLVLATGRRIIAGTPLAFGEGDTKGRIENLAKWKKPAVWVSAAAVVVIALVIAICATNEREEYSWVKAELMDDGVEINFELKEPTQSWAIYMDMYEDGELISSSPCLVSGFEEDDDVTEKEETFRLQVVTPGGAGTTWRGEWSVIFSYDGASSKFKLDLPKLNYTGWGDALARGDTVNRFSMQMDLLGDDEVVLYSIMLSAYPEDAVVSENIIMSNDTVIQYRLVTSTEGAEQFTA